MKDFKTLRIWEQSHEIVLEIYHITKGFPKDEIYGLSNQMRRAATSIPTNIAEGCGRNSDAELNRFLIIAMGSSAELEYQILLAKDLSYLSQEQYDMFSEKIIQLRKMLNTFIKKLTYIP